MSAQPENMIPETRTVEGDTRRQIMLMLLKLAPVTASDLADRLDMSAAGIRRHLDILVAEGLAETLDRRVRSVGTAAAPRGRPAKAFRLTDQGRSQFGHSYDQLATDALDILRETGGEEAVRRLAAQRIARIVEESPGRRTRRIQQQRSWLMPRPCRVRCTSRAGWHQTATTTARWPMWPSSTLSCRG